MKVKLISLFGIEPNFETRTPHDLDNVNIKSFSLHFDKLNFANEFKMVWKESNDLLENVIANKNSKSGFKAAKNLAVEKLFAEQKKKIQEQSLLEKQYSKMKNRR